MIFILSTIWVIGVCSRPIIVWSYYNDLKLPEFNDAAILMIGHSGYNIFCILIHGNQYSQNFRNIFFFENYRHIFYSEKKCEN